jgi:hypothetical protein
MLAYNVQKNDPKSKDQPTCQQLHMRRPLYRILLLFWQP